MTPETLTYQDARDLFNALPGWLEENRNITGRAADLHGDVDQYQGATGYTGETPTAGVKGFRFYMEQLEKRYVTEDLCTDILQHRTDGVMGSDPKRGFDTEGDEPNAEEEEQQRVIDEWWEERGLTEVLESHADALGSEHASILRFRIVGQEDETGAISADTPEEALEHIHVEQVGRDQAHVHTDDETLQKIGVFVSEATDDNEGDRAEITFVDEQGSTILRVIDQGGKRLHSQSFDDLEAPRPDAEEQGSTPLDLGGKLLMREDTGRLVISESVRSNQYTLNTTRTWAHIIDEKAGFPELHLTDIEPPVDDQGKAVQPKRGPDTIQYHVSLPDATRTLSGEEIEESRNPNVQQFAGASTESLREDCDECREAVYRGAKQLHRFISGDAAASGEARVQARADFVQDLRRLKKTLDLAGRWMLETAWALAEALSMQQHSGAVATFECVLDAGPITPSERDALVNMVNEGAMSLKRALSVMGVDDPQAEIDQIREELEDPITQGQAQTKQIIDSVAAGRFYRQQSGGTAEGIEEQGNERGEGV